MNQLSARTLASGSLLAFQELSIINSSNLLTLRNHPNLNFKEFYSIIVLCLAVPKELFILSNLKLSMSLLNQTKFIPE